MTRRTRGEHFTSVLANRTELLVLFPFHCNAFNYIICSIWSQGPPKNSFENIIFQNSMNSHRHSRKWVQVVPLPSPPTAQTHIFVCLQWRPVIITWTLILCLFIFRNHRLRAKATKLKKIYTKKFRSRTDQFPNHF